MAHSLGLHRHQHSHNSPSNASTPQLDLDRNIWWSLFCLEKMMALQTGRPSTIRDEDCDQTLPAPATFPILHHLIGLSQVQSAIARSMTSQVNQKRGMRDFFYEAAQLDARLIEWAMSLPDGLRPGATLYCTPEDQPFATFFSACYHEALITLHRTALILDTSVFGEQVRRHAPEGQASYRLNQAEDICVASARAIVRALNELKSSCGDLAHLLTASAPLLATFVLTISILKHPTRWNIRADLALLLNIVAFTEDVFVSAGQDPTFNEMFALMRDAASKHVESAASTSDTDIGTTHFGPTRQDSLHQDELPEQQSPRVNNITGDNIAHCGPEQTTGLECLGNEEPWSQLLSGNLDLGTAPWDYDLETFLGLPHFNEGVLGL
ncbi:Transcription factor fungi [Macrophomina phaseolina MS6]|uniref:Transcription factor fungi n=1 Tax=Macrophomina phaseolina (strain MS6) TaxID=1126212 RepID=K2R378_MACPH|nr:Transcription factor fungi [Macrophomina phaseolina MS6]